MRTGLLALLFVCCALGQLDCMAWMCLERCNETASSIAGSLQQLQGLSDRLNSVAFELYNLGPGGALVTNALTAVGPSLRAMGFQTYPMISSYPYPPEFLSWMRQLWETPSIGQMLIGQMKKEAATNGWAGYQVDWEPTATATPQDAVNYAAFLTTMSKALAPLKILPTVATWNSIWNLTAIGKSSVYRVVSMSTYATKLATFEQRLQETLKAVPASKLSVGVENWPDVDANFTERLQLTIANKVPSFAVWKMPITEEWNQGLRQYCKKG